MSLKEDSLSLENVPYFEEVETHKSTQSLRVRFHYFKGSVFFFDERTKTIKERRRAFYGVVVFRPQKALLEVRAKHKDIAHKTAIRTATALGIKGGIYSLDFRKQEYIKKFSIGYVH